MNKEVFDPIGAGALISKVGQTFALDQETIVGVHVLILYRFTSNMISNLSMPSFSIKCDLIM